MTSVVDIIYYYKNDKKKLGSYPHFKENFNTLKYVLLGYCMNKLGCNNVNNFLIIPRYKDKIEIY
jgi:hypothetical protein